MKRIIVEHLSKTYHVHHEEKKEMSFRELLLSQMSSLFAPSSQENAFDALHDVSFEVEEGEVLGLIGRNGSGKSTLLKILSNITPPSAGKVTIRGKVSSLLEVGTGFHGELTGRENIYLSGVILGMSRSEISKHFDEIVDFAGVERFLAIPVKRYSSGMRLRLAFSIAAHLRPEVFLIDEVLAVGDYEFEKKCLDSMRELGKAGRTIIFVSHNLLAIKRLCSRVMVLEKGYKKFIGDTVQGVAFYLGGEKNSRSSVEWPDQGLRLDSILSLHSIRALNQVHEKKESFFLDESVTLEIRYQCKNRSENYMGVFSFYDESETLLFSSSHTIGLHELEETRGTTGSTLRCTIPENIFAPGAITVGLSIFNIGTGKLIDVVETTLFTENALVTFLMQEPEALVHARSEGVWQGVQGKIKPLICWQKC
jgi:lipopolysaccharide transport system ATP-binding protein